MPKIAQTIAFEHEEIVHMLQEAAKTALNGKFPSGSGVKVSIVPAATPEGVPLSDKFRGVVTING